jgi:hypothetical protein
LLFPSIILDESIDKNDSTYEASTDEGDDEEGMNDYPYLQYLRHADIHKYKNAIFLNAAGAPWDVFAFHEIEPVGFSPSRKKILIVCMQTKKTDGAVGSPMTITDEIFQKEYEKVTLRFITCLRYASCLWLY